MKSAWHELGWPVRVSVIASLPGGLAGILLITTFSSKISLLAVPPLIQTIPLWILLWLFLFSLPLGGLVTIVVSTMLLFRPMDETQRDATAFSALALSLIVLFLSLPQLLWINGRLEQYPTRLISLNV